MEQSITTIDLYEGSYYMLKGCELVRLAGCKVNGKVNCKMTFSHPNISELQVNYFQGQAEVNLISFRRTFGQLFQWVHREKKRCKNILKNGGEI